MAMISAKVASTIEDLAKIAGLPLKYLGHHHNKERFQVIGAPWTVVLEERQAQAYRVDDGSMSNTRIHLPVGGPYNGRGWQDTFITDVERFALAHDIKPNADVEPSPRPKRKPAPVASPVPVTVLAGDLAEEEVWMPSGVVPWVEVSSLARVRDKDDPTRFYPVRIDKSVTRRTRVVVVQAEPERDRTFSDEKTGKPLATAHKSLALMVLEAFGCMHAQDPIGLARHLNGDVSNCTRSNLDYPQDKRGTYTTNGPRTNPGTTLTDVNCQKAVLKSLILGASDAVLGEEFGVTRQTMNKNLAGLHRPHLKPWTETVAQLAEHSWPEDQKQLIVQTLVCILEQRESVVGLVEAFRIYGDLHGLIDTPAKEALLTAVAAALTKIERNRGQGFSGR